MLFLNSIEISIGSSDQIIRKDSDSSMNAISRVALAENLPQICVTYLADFNAKHCSLIW